MKRALFSLVVLGGLSCLNIVDERWCDTATPCTEGFVCTDTGHCVLARFDGGVGGGSGRDAGTDGGSLGGGTGGALGGGTGGSLGGGTGGSLGGGTGGSFGGGTGGSVGGGTGGAGGGTGACGPMSCDGCCSTTGTCIPAFATSVINCGARGSVCVTCPSPQNCFGGQCQNVMIVDAGLTAPVGSTCMNDPQCGASGVAFCIPDQGGFVGGYCSQFCDTTPCPTGAVCIPAQTGGGMMVKLCLAACDAMTAPCRTGYSCSMGICIPGP